MNNSIYDRLEQRQAKLAVVGLGYVGMPLAVEFDKHFDVIGFDLNEKKIHEYKAGHDGTGEVGDEALAHCHVDFTSDPTRLKEASFVIVAVPTPIRSDKTPDLDPVIGASQIVGQNLKEGAIVVFESTVYPGVTEEICANEISKYSGLQCGEGFYLGYSPERINPGDKVHRLCNITKIVSGTNKMIRDEIQKVYSAIINESTGGMVYPAESIKVAEAAKLCENTQRDVNIALMNEFAMAFNRMGIQTIDVIRAMNTKWNALGFYPGFVGGHCIGVDPYYFIENAEEKGYHSSLVLAGRRINEDMPTFVAQETMKTLIQNSETKPSEWNIVILGMTFKGNCPDLRNTKSIALKHALEEYGIHVSICDPVADQVELEEQFGVKPVAFEDVRNADCLIFAADHDVFKNLSMDQILSMFEKNGAKVFIDIRNLFNGNAVEEKGMHYWCL